MNESLIRSIITRTFIEFGFYIFLGGIVSLFMGASKISLVFISIGLSSVFIGGIGNMIFDNIATKKWEGEIGEYK